ncbi:MAG: ATPase domain-containing protein [Methanothrix sp.]|nr:ATPase domain-containing protein [Methanothrix sp.]
MISQEHWSRYPYYSRDELMLKNTINGLDKILFDDIPKGSVILVTGAEGTLKSGLVFSMMANYISANDEHGLYVTLEQNIDSHIRNMNSLGIREERGLHIFDYRDMRLEWMDSELDLIKTTEEVIDSYKEKYDNLTLFALDSLNALYSISDQGNMRNKIYNFFSHLRDEELTSFLIMESAQSRISGQFSSFHQVEHFLADGTIELGMIEGSGGVKRYIQILKMRATKHAMEKHQIIIGDNGLNILGPIY